jgi:hypothetical protein
MDIRIKFTKVVFLHLPSSSVRARDRLGFGGLGGLGGFGGLGAWVRRGVR